MKKRKARIQVALKVEMAMKGRAKVVGGAVKGPHSMVCLAQTSPCCRMDDQVLVEVGLGRSMLRASWRWAVVGVVCRQGH